jgi:hypothetical protein
MRRTNRTRTAADWSARFLDQIRAGRSIKDACARAGVGRRTVYDRRDRDPEFAQVLADALEDACDELEAEARRRALQKDKPSGALLMFLLRAYRPERFGNKIDHNHGGRVALTVEDLTDDELCRIAAGKDRAG